MGKLSTLLPLGPHPHCVALDASGIYACASGFEIKLLMRSIMSR
jgi:hypothetical protein